MLRAFSSSPAVACANDASRFARLSSTRSPRFRIHKSLLRLQREGHHDRLMVGIGKARIVNKAARDRHIVGNEKAVHGQKELPLMIRRVGVAARRLRVVFIQRRDQRQVFPLEKLRFDWLRPAKNLL